MYKSWKSDVQLVTVILTLTVIYSGIALQRLMSSRHQNVRHRLINNIESKSNCKQNRHGVIKCDMCTLKTQCSVPVTLSLELSRSNYFGDLTI